MITYPLNNIEYTAEDAELFHVTRTSGIYANDSFEYSVSGADNNIVINTGIAWIKNAEFSGKVAAQKEALVLDMGVADQNYPRIDAVVIQFNANSNSTNIIVKKGTASTSPVAPEIVRTETVYELHLYHVYRTAGALAIYAQNVSDLRLNNAYCGLMADSVTRVDTDSINAQIEALIEDLKNEIDGVKDGTAFVLKTDIISIERGGTGSTTAADALNNLGALALTGLIRIDNYSNINNYIDVGSYYCQNRSIASSLSNTPFDTGFALFVFNVNALESFRTQLALSTDGRIVTRYTANSGTTWTNWGNPHGITFGTTTPSGGSHGDIYIMYEE